MQARVFACIVFGIILLNANCHFVVSRCRCLTRDAMGRLQIPADSEVRRSEAWKAFTVVACVCPPSLREHVEKAAARKVGQHELV